MDCYAVFGNPVAHSLSPDIHRRFAEQTGEAIRYDRQLVEPGHFVEAAAAFFAAGGAGLNVTVPFKGDAYEFAEQLTRRARRAGAVNTLAKTPEGVLGDNTDGVGLLRDLTANLGWPVGGSRVLVVGAGGAVRGILSPLLAEQPASVVIANRTVERARQLARAFAGDSEIDAVGFDELEGRCFDLVINGTSASLVGELPPLPASVIATDTRCYDMMYAAALTVFLRWARERGAAQTADGLGMLVEQAAESFLLWRGVRPQTAEVIAAVRMQLASDNR